MAEEKQPLTWKDRRPYRRPLNEIIADLSASIPDELNMLKTKKVGKPGRETSVTFLPWYNATRILDMKAPGWEYAIKSLTVVNNQLIVTVTLTIHAEEGNFTREATGIEDEEISGYGDTVSNASSMALRRAAAHFGLGRYLYSRS